MKIQHVKTSFSSSFFEEEKKISSLGNSKICSSIESSGKKQSKKVFFPVFAAVFDCLRLFFCQFFKKDPIDWEETLAILSKMQEEVHNKKDYETNRIKRFNNGLNNLSRDAKKRLKEHILILLSESNMNNVRFNEDYFQNIDNPILKKAMDEFHEEAIRKTKSFF